MVNLLDDADRKGGVRGRQSLREGEEDGEGERERDRERERGDIWRETEGVG